MVAASIIVLSIAGFVVAVACVEILVILLRSVSSYITMAHEQLTQDNVMTRIHEQSLRLDLAF
tara:strand:- start:443 stop:631 length:189 start_codon:yes stop_codon:yes gene_type:complete